MQIYDFEKRKKLITKELEDRVYENERKLDNYLKELNNELETIEGKLNEFYEFETMEINSSILKNKVIGTKNLDSKLIYKSISNKKITCSKFINCKFNNVRFENCILYGVSFENCKFSNVKFSNCDFHEKDGIVGVFKKNCIFEKCIFDNTDLKKVIFLNNNFERIKFIFTDLRNCIFNYCKFGNIVFCDCNLKSTKMINLILNYLEFEDTYITKVDENTFFDKVKNTDNSKKNYDKLSKFYKNVSSLYESNRLLAISGEYYYLHKCNERKCLRGIQRIKSKVFWAICGYGERPTYALITSFEIVIIFALIYIFSGLSINGRIINYGLDIFSYLYKRAIYVDLIKCMYFSLVTFTSVGYGDIFPIGYSVIFSCFEMILGVTMVGIWTATLARKIIR